MSFPAVFLDRDGTINEDPGYLSNPDSVKLLPGVSQGISELKSVFGFKIIVVSNQSGISRGLITEEQVKLVNAKINELLSVENAEVDDFFYCPFHPDFSTEDESKCRKPSPEMIFEAARKHTLDLAKSYMVGDKAIDVECGKNAGVKQILLNSDINSEEINSLKKAGISPNFVAHNFLEAVNFIKQDFN